VLKLNPSGKIKKTQLTQREFPRSIWYVTMFLRETNFTCQEVLCVRQGQPPSPARAAVFFTTLLLAGIALSNVAPPGPVGGAIRHVLMFVGIALLFTTFADGRPVREVFRLRALSLWGVVKSICLGLASWGLIYMLGSLMILLVQRLGGKMYQPYPELQQLPFGVALVVAGLIPALCEEFAFRGYLQYGLEGLGPRAAVVLTGLLFGVMHFSVVRLVPLALLGMIFAAAVQRVGSILPSMIMHFVNNGTVLALSFGLGQAGSGSADTSGPSPSGMTLVMMTGVVITLGLVVWAMLKSFGPGDLARPAEGPVRAEQQQAEVRGGLGRWVPVILGLLPGLALYAWAGLQELHTVFGPK
jgi:membrane protease YdiL (CAAX protease family)